MLFNVSVFVAVVNVWEEEEQEKRKKRHLFANCWPKTWHCTVIL